jgi:hypothetical protein
MGALFQDRIEDSDSEQNRGEQSRPNTPTGTAVGERMAVEYRIVE